MWAAEIQGDEPMTLRFDLGEGYDIQEFWMWQYNDESETDRGLKSMDVIFRDEHGDIVGEITGATIEQANGDPVLPYYFCPIVQCIRFIEFRMLENYGDTNFIGFSEVLFAGRPKDAFVPEPDFHLTSLILSLLMFNRYRRRNR